MNSVPHPKKATRVMKRVAWCVVILSNLWFMYFTVARASQRDSSWQKMFVLACLIGNLIDMFLFEPMETVWIHFAIPGLAREEIATKLDLVKQCMDGVFSSEERQDVTRLDVPSYFYVSSQIACEYSSLFESSVVLSHKAIMPPAGLFSQLKTDESIAITHNYSTCRKIVTVLSMSKLLLLVGSLPQRMQSAILHVAQPVLLGAIFLYLHYLHTYVLFLVPFIGLVVVYYFIYRPIVKRRAAISSSVLPLTERSVTFTSINVSIRHNLQHQDSLLDDGDLWILKNQTSVELRQGDIAQSIIPEEVDMQELSGPDEPDSVADEVIFDSDCSDGSCNSDLRSSIFSLSSESVNILRGFAEVDESCAESDSDDDVDNDCDAKDNDESYGDSSSEGNKENGTSDNGGRSSDLEIKSVSSKESNALIVNSPEFSEGKDSRESIDESSDGKPPSNKSSVWESLEKFTSSDSEEDLRTANMLLLRERKR